MLAKLAPKNPAKFQFLNVTKYQMGAEDKKQVNKCLYSSFDALLYLIFHGKKNNLKFNFCSKLKKVREQSLG